MDDKISRTMAEECCRCCECCTGEPPPEQPDLTIEQIEEDLKAELSRN